MFRFERKFIINNLTIPELENILRNSPLKFKKNYQKGLSPSFDILKCSRSAVMFCLSVGKKIYAKAHVSMRG